MLFKAWYLLYKKIKISKPWLTGNKFWLIRAVKTIIVVGLISDDLYVKFGIYYYKKIKICIKIYIVRFWSNNYGYSECIENLNAGDPIYSFTNQ